ncbi:MAG: hypothetical protein KF851_09685 [Pirellulaceae bacterium]|nr:hypothetical protein [Pirellulaceae bacterium]
MKYGQRMVGLVLWAMATVFGGAPFLGGVICFAQSYSPTPNDGSRIVDGAFRYLANKRFPDAALLWAPVVQDVVQIDEPTRREIDAVFSRALQEVQEKRQDFDAERAKLIENFIERAERNLERSQKDLLQSITGESIRSVARYLLHESPRFKALKNDESLMVFMANGHSLSSILTEDEKLERRRRLNIDVWQPSRMPVKDRIDAQRWFKHPPLDVITWDLIWVEELDFTEEQMAKRNELRLAPIVLELTKPKNSDTKTPPRQARVGGLPSQLGSLPTFDYRNDPFHEAMRRKRETQQHRQFEFARWLWENSSKEQRETWQAIAIQVVLTRSGLEHPLFVLNPTGELLGLSENQKQRTLELIEELSADEQSAWERYVESLRKAWASAEWEARRLLTADQHREYSRFLQIWRE